MSEAHEFLELADWRRRVVALYADVRAAPEAGRRIAWNEWRAGRNVLFKNHPQSPLTADQRFAFAGLDYFAYDPAWRILATVKPDTDGRCFHSQLGADGDFTMKRVGWVAFSVGGIGGRLALYWIKGYGGGLFLPLKDNTSGITTYGGGRYLFDTIKGADLGVDGGRLVLDFNYAYNPSCAYHSRWVCPLAPAENTMSFPVAAGEKLYFTAAHEAGLAT